MILCPGCDLMIQHVFHHVFEKQDNAHCDMMRPYVAYIKEHAINKYAFTIAEELVEIAENDVNQETPYFILGTNIAGLTTFVSQIIGYLGYDNRMRAYGVRTAPVGTLNDTTNEHIIQACKYAITYTASKRLLTSRDIWHMCDSLPTTCAVCEAAQATQLQYVDNQCAVQLPSNRAYICEECTSAIGRMHTVAITKIFTFAAAHHLPGHPRLCQYTHGHEWRLEITVKAPVHPQTQMVMDFSNLKKFVNSTIIDKLDHNYVNEFIWNPTAENICAWIWDQLMHAGLKGIERIKLWEAPDSFAELLKTDY